MDHRLLPIQRDMEFGLHFFLPPHSSSSKSFVSNPRFSFWREGGPWLDVVAPWLWTGTVRYPPHSSIVQSQWGPFSCRNARLFTFFRTWVFGKIPARNISCSNTSGELLCSCLMRCLCSSFREQFCLWMFCGYDLDLLSYNSHKLIQHSSIHSTTPKTWFVLNYWFEFVDNFH